MRTHLDFETFSEADLKKVGGWVYSEHHSTEILCLVYQIGDNKPVLWLPWEEPPQELFDAIADGTLVFAHNAFFERAIWENVCVARLGWPPIPPHKYRCTAAKAAAFCLPRDLSGAGRALGLETVKDEEGKRVMMKLCRPRKPSKLNPATRWTPETVPDDFKTLYAYCIMDVKSEKALDDALPDLSETEQLMWLLDQKINTRGVGIDLELTEAAIAVAEEKTGRLNRELHSLTKFKVSKATAVAKLLQWVREQGLEIDDLKKDTIRDVLKDKSLDPDIKRALEIRKSVSKTSVKKYDTLRRCRCSDGRIRDILMYHAASTGRWGGKFFQPQNIARGTLKNPNDAIDMIKLRDVDLLDMIYDNTMEALSSCIRGALVAADGKEFLVSDFSSIEACVLAWIAYDYDLLQLFYDKEPVYEHMASAIYNKPIDKITEKERQLGKQAVLGCGYGMGPPKFVETCEKYDINLADAATPDILKQAIQLRIDKLIKEMDWFDDEDNVEKKQNRIAKKEKQARELKVILDIIIKDFPDDLISIINICGRKEMAIDLLVAEFVVNKYRTSREPIKKCWYNMEGAAVQAIRTGQVINAGKVTWYVKSNVLYCRLPSGRTLKYISPTLKPVRTPWGEMKDQIRFMGVDSTTRQWTRQSTYGGKLVENVVQAIARDLLRDAIIRCERAGFPIVFHVHDEVIAETVIGERTIGELDNLMSVLPKWAEGCPVSAEGEVMQRYKK